MASGVITECCRDCFVPMTGLATTEIKNLSNHDRVNIIREYD